VSASSNNPGLLRQGGDADLVFPKRDGTVERYMNLLGACSKRSRRWRM